MAVTDSIRNRLFDPDNAVANGLASLGFRLGGMAAGFLLGVLLAKTLGPSQFGVYGLVVALAALGMNMALLGTPQLAVREFATLIGVGRTDALRPFARSLLVATGASATAIAVLAVAAVWLVDPSLMTIVVPGAISIPFLAITALSASQLRGLGAMNQGQVMDIFARPAAALVLLLSLIAIGWAVDSATALWVQASIAALAAAISLVWLFRRLPPASGPSHSTPWLAAALPLGMVDLLRMVDGTSGSVVLGWLSNDVELGLYRAAISCSVLVSMPVTILHVIYAPTVARMVELGDTARLQSLLGRIALAASALVGAITAACLVAGRPLINLVFGPAYDGSWAPLLVLCIAQLAFALAGMGPILLAMARRERQLISIYLLAIPVAVIASVLLVRPFGATGVAVGQIVSLSLVAGLSCRDARRALGVDCSIFSLLRR